MRIGKLGIVCVLLLMVCNSVGAVWIYTGVDIMVGDMTLNVVTDQNFSYVEIGGNYTNLSWGGVTYHNLTFVSNVSSNESVIQRSTGFGLNQVTNISFDLYAPSDYSVSVLLKVLTAVGVADASVVPTLYHSNTTHRQYQYDYNPSDTIPDAGLGWFDVNISATVTNATLTYTGYNLTDNLFFVFLIEPPYSGASVYNTTLNSVNLTWLNGNNSEYTIVVQNNNSYPANPSDGWVRSNSSSFITFNDSSVFSTRYYTVFNYNSTYNAYSNGLDIPWGALGLSCFNESNPSQAIGFDIEITNSDASITYTASDLTNIHYIDLNDIPFGDDTIFVVSNSSYRQRIYYYDISLNTFLNYSFFLPPIEVPVDPGSGDDGGNTTTTILCLISVLDELSQPVPNATVDVKRYINTTDSYEDIAIRITDGNGQFTEWLIPNILYRFEITKSEYVQTGSKFWTPTSSEYAKTFMLEFEEDEYLPGESELEEIIFNGYISGNILYINYSDNMNETINTQIYIYETNHSTTNTVLFDSNSKTGYNSFQVSFNINTSNTYTVILHYNHTTFGYQSRTIIFEGEYDTVTTQSKGDLLFELNYGTNPFGWSNVFMWIILIAGCMTLDQRGAGVTLIIVGFICLFLSYWIGFNTVLSGIAGGVIPIIFIALGFMVAWSDVKKLKGAA